MKRNTDFMLRDIAGEVILVPTGAATQQFNGMITLNEVAAFIWKNLDESKSKEALLVEGFVGALYEHGLVLDE